MNVIKTILDIDTSKTICWLPAFLSVFSLHSSFALAQYSEGDPVNLNAIDPNCFVSVWPLPGCPGRTGIVTDIRPNMPGTPTFLHYQQRMVVREELAEENFTCDPLPEDSYDSTITHSAEHFLSLRNYLKTVNR